jgi:hypothetical protein
MFRHDNPLRIPLSLRYVPSLLSLFPPSHSSSAPAEPATPTAAPAGWAMHDGKFEFRVLSMTRAAQAGDLSNQFEVVHTQGEFIILTISVTN